FLVALGLMRVHNHFLESPVQDLATASAKSWLDALVLLVYSYGGFENAVMAGSEIKEPRRNVPFSLCVGLLVCVVLYTLLQYVTMMTIGMMHTDRPLADVARVLIGPRGALIVDLAVIISTF